MTLRDIVQGRDIPFIEYRVYVDIPGYGQSDEFFGTCAYTNGELKSLDGDNYYIDAEIEKYEWYTDCEGRRVLCVWEAVDVM